MTTNTGEKLQNFVITPRRIVTDYRERKITLTEWKVYVWVRMNASIYGIATVSIPAIREDMLPHLKGKSGDNFVNKVLLSLKRKKYIYFADRQGRRGSFGVHFGDWILPDKKIKTLDGFFGRNEVRSESTEKAEEKAEVSNEIVDISQKLAEGKKQLIRQFSVNSAGQSVRSSHTDTDNQKDILIADSDKKTFKEIAVGNFSPTTYEEQRTLEIAQRVGEKNMTFLLSILKKHGFGVIEKAWGRYREDRDDMGRRGKRIKNPPAYFNSIIQKLIS